MSYPQSSGWRPGSAETSRQAALDLRPMAMTQGALALAVVRETGKASAEEVAGILARRGHAILLNSVRARLCCLHKQGVLRDSGERAIGESGRCKVVRWRLATPEERAAFDAKRRGI